MQEDTMAKDKKDKKNKIEKIKLPDNEEDCLALGTGFEWVQPDDSYVCECMEPMTYDMRTGKLTCY